MEDYDIFLEVEAIPENLALIRSLVRTYLEIEKINKTQNVQLTSIIDELVTNVAEHAYKPIKGKDNTDKKEDINKEKDTVGKILRVYLKIEEEKVELVVEDFGNGIDKNSKSKEEGGMGLIIVKNVADIFDCEEKEQGVKFRIIKKIEKEGK